MKKQDSNKNGAIKLSADSRERLRKAIHLRGTSYYKITKHFGYAPSTITNWLSGKVERPDRAKINAVCQYLGISLYWLLTGEDDSMPGNNLAKEPENTENYAKENITPLSPEINLQTEQYKVLRTDLTHIRREIAELKNLLNRLLKTVNPKE